MDDDITLDDPDIIHWGRTLIYDGLAQTDIDMNNFRLINLDDSNLQLGGAPPTVTPPPEQFLHSWNSATRTWTPRQVRCDFLLPDPSTGGLTLDQQRAIHHVGVVNEGFWRANIIENAYLPPLNGFRAPTGPVHCGNVQVKNVALPTDGADAVNLGYVLNTLPGLKVKEAVKCATTAQIGLAGTPIIDGYPTQIGDRVLIKDSSGDFEYLNGIWIVRSGNWTNAPNSRAPDADTAAELYLATCFVLNGAQNGGSTWIETTLLAAVGVGNPVHFVKFASSTIGPPGPPGQGVPPGGDTGQVLAKIDGTDYNTQWVDPSGGLGTPPQVYAYLQTVATGNIGPLNNLSLDGRMAGLAGQITPVASGKLVATIAGVLWNDNPAGQATVRMVVGAGTAPRQGEVQPPPENCLVVGALAATFEGGATHAVPFSVSDVIVVTPGIQYWYDLKLQPGTVGRVGVSGVSISVAEIP